MTPIIKEKKKEILTLILLIIFFYRSPFIFLNGRFMAEEGSIFFANAYNNNFFYSLFFIDFKELFIFIILMLATTYSSIS